MRHDLSYPPFSHGRIVCQKCNAVVAQCRCPESCKVVGMVRACKACQTADANTRAHDGGENADS